MFYLGGVGVSLFLTVLLFSKSSKSTADKILVAWLLVITIHLLLFYFGKIWAFPDLLGLGMPLPLVHGPFLLLYTQSLTGRANSLRISLVHFVPALVVLVYIIPFLLLPVDQKIAVYKSKGGMKHLD